MSATDNDPNYADFGNFDELARLRYTIAKFKEYDRKRKTYLRHLERRCENYLGKIKEYEKLTERQHDEIDELIDAYEKAKPLIAHPDQKAYVYELLQRIEYLKPFESLYNSAMKRCGRQESRIQELEELVKALQENIKSLHKIQNGNK